MVGKYTGLSDAYLSVIKSLQHACMDARLKLKVGRERCGRRGGVWG
jgi:CTP synthase